jgi:hypothetical protein
MGEAADQRRAVARLELGEVGTVDDARDHLAHVVGRLGSAGTMPMMSSRGIERRARLGERDVRLRRGPEIARTISRASASA